ncbi:MAG: KGK domain-containing protein [Nostoc sp.]|uniref:KGK domain-containing protein n=1 Tax=Nostoc sp. TaxID=1180 RepID=UPI002FF7CBF3
MSNVTILSGQEVISMDKGLSFLGIPLLKFQDMEKQIKKILESQIPNYIVWTTEGVKAEVLQPGKDWQNGKLKLVVSYHVEFIPDALPGSESPLADLRSQLNSE